MATRKQIASRKLDRLSKLTSLPYTQYAKVNELVGKVRFGNATKSDVSYLQSMYNKHFAKESLLDKIRYKRQSARAYARNVESLFNQLSTPNIKFEWSNKEINQFGKRMMDKSYLRRISRMTEKQLEKELAKQYEFVNTINSALKRMKVASESLVERYIESLRIAMKENRMSRTTIAETHDSYIRGYVSQTGASYQDAEKSWKLNLEAKLDEMHSYGDLTTDEYFNIVREISK